MDSLERILKNHPELDTPLYGDAYLKQKEGVPPREVGAFWRQLSRLFVLGGSGGVTLFTAACQPVSGMVLEVTPTPDKEGIRLTLPPLLVESAAEFPEEPTTMVEPTLTPTEVPPTVIPPTVTVVETPPQPDEAIEPTSTVSPEPPKTAIPEPEPTQTPTPEILWGRVITQKELDYLGSLGGGEEMLELVDENVRGIPALKPFLLMGAQAILSGQTGVVEVLPPAGDGEPPWFVFRSTVKKEQEGKVSVFNIISKEDPSLLPLRVGDNLTVIAKIDPGAFLVMYEKWQDGQVTYCLGYTSLTPNYQDTEDFLASFMEEETWQPNEIKYSLWQEVLGEVRRWKYEPQVEVRADFLNLRTGPGTNYEIIGGYNNGEKVRVVGQSENGWFRTVWTDKEGVEHEGWLSGEYVEANEAAREVDLVPRALIPSPPEPKSQPQTESEVLTVPIDAQNFSLSCESSASAMAASYHRPNPPDGYSSWEEYFVRVIPQHCNPHRGFRGRINGGLSTSCDAAGLGYGVYAEPIAQAFQQAGIPAQVEYGVDYDAVEEAIGKGKPVIVWISGKSEPVRRETDPETGQEYTLILGEHAWTIIGVRGEGGARQFLVNDPWKGRQYWVRGFPRWSDFNGMRVVVG